jgi:hypothetical protein
MHGKTLFALHTEQRINYPKLWGPSSNTSRNNIWGVFCIFEKLSINYLEIAPLQCNGAAS